MKRDERSLKWAKVNGYKYVECDDEGNIKGYGFSRHTLEYHNLSEYNVMTIRQYEKATEREQREQAMKYLQEHHSPSEVSDFQAAMNIAVAKAIDSTINKSIEWLNGNIHYDENGEGNMEWFVPFADDDEMVENFKKFMED